MRLRHSTRVGAIFLLVAVSHPPDAIAQQRSIRDAQAVAAIEGLWSADDETRQAAKQRLLDLGSDAAPRLAAFLKDLVEHRWLRFATEKQVEGAALLDAVPRPRPASLDGLASVKRLDISARLRKDSAEVLGRLESGMAASMLIEKLLSDYDGEASAAMQALTDMGSTVVPAIVEAIPRGEQRAALLYAEEARMSGKDLRWKIEWKRDIFQSRAATVLGRVGDVRALKVLTNLPTDDNAWKRRFVDDAIGNIFTRRWK
jgi:HEAT repeat protein